MRARSKKAVFAASSDNAGSITVCGVRTVSAMLEAGRLRYLLVTHTSNSRVQEILYKAEKKSIPIRQVADVELVRLSDNSQHQGVAGLAEPPVADWRQLLRRAEAPLVVLDGVTDPRNLGAVLRVGRAFAVAAVVMPSRRSAPLSAAAAKASCGAAAFVPLHRVTNLRRALTEIKQAGWFVVGACEDAKISLVDATPPSSSPICWVFGDEGSGLRRLTVENCDLLARIPTVVGEAGCLNVATACAACLATGANRWFPE